MSELKISPELLQISPEVQDALKNKKPVVALESTIISHGMPFPQNAQTAIEVEETIRKQGAVPATIAIIGGVMKVGLSKEEIELLGREGHNVTKVSRRDLPFVVAAGKNGATTVASTMIIAALAGIKVFATGGIGGVHRGAEHTCAYVRRMSTAASFPSGRTRRNGASLRRWPPRLPGTVCFSPLSCGKTRRKGAMRWSAAGGVWQPAGCLAWTRWTRCSLRAIRRRGRHAFWRSI